MCDNSAVSWSEYESHKRLIESEVRDSILMELLQLLRISEDNGDPECFIQGIRRSINSVGRRRTTLSDPDHPKLF